MKEAIDALVDTLRRQYAAFQRLEAEVDAERERLDQLGDLTTPIAERVMARLAQLEARLPKED